MVAIAIALAGCAESAPGDEGAGITRGPQTVGIDIVGFAFEDEMVEIFAGDRVRWINQDSALHTVSSDGELDSGDLAKGDSYVHTFLEAGEFSYRCDYHPSMTGKIVVLEA